MPDNSRFSRKKILSYLSNALLLAIILILIIPSWRVSFQGWYQQFFLSEANFESSKKLEIPNHELQWELFDMEDKMYNFAELRGKPVVLDCWATWCAPCRAELPSFNRLYEEMKSKIHFLAVSQESIETIQKSGLSEKYPFLYSAQHYPNTLHVKSYPTLCIFDKDLNLVYRSEGAAELYTDKNINFLEGLLAN